jgi:predicted DCC family thiol-disulfide oxidoreductase YuxK
MPDWQFKLLYDGACPFCRLEARWLAWWNKRGKLVLEDIAAPGFDAARYGVSHEDLMGVMHGVLPDGRLVRKVEAFRHAYRAVDLGWLLAPTGWPGLRWIFDGLYAAFARYRVPVSRLFGGSCDSGTCDVAARRKRLGP